MTSTIATPNNNTILVLMIIMIIITIMIKITTIMMIVIMILIIMIIIIIKNNSYYNTIKTLSTCNGTNSFKQTVLTKIRLLPKEQFDQSLHCLFFA